MSTRPNVIFLLVDCLRADRLFGSSRTAVTPTLDALCARGTSFQQCVSTTTTTTPCVASLMTGLYPAAHGVRSLLGYQLAPRPTLAESFRAAGYYTRAEVTGPLLPEVGLGRGFDDYICRPESQYLDMEWGTRLGTSLAQRQFTEPWFLFLHLWELHMLWQQNWMVTRRVSPAFDSPRYGASSYDRALSELDLQLGKLLAALDPARTLVVLSGDHGEQIYQTVAEEESARLRWWWARLLPLHRYLPRFLMWQLRSQGIGHGFDLSEEMIRVPLVLAGAPFPTASRVPNLVRQIDLFPTLAEALELPLPAGCQVHGRSLMPLVQGKPWEDLPAYIETMNGILPDPLRWLAGIRTPRHKFICAPNNPDRPAELYDLQSDPAGKQSLLQTQPELAAQLESQLMALREAAPEELKLAGAKMSVADEAAVRERLRNLGYVD